jgi:hypothetical protein
VPVRDGPDRGVLVKPYARGTRICAGLAVAGSSPVKVGSHGSGR